MYNKSMQSDGFPLAVVGGLPCRSSRNHLAVYRSAAPDLNRWVVYCFAKLSHKLIHRLQVFCVGQCDILIIIVKKL